MADPQDIAKLVRYHADLAFMHQGQVKTLIRISESLMCCSLANVEHLSRANDLMREIEGRWCDIGDLFHEAARKLEKI